MIKKKFFTINMPDNIPALNQLLKEKKTNLADFI
jgi:hypothetical protein